MSAEVLLVDDVLFEEHGSTSNHPERPARLVAARAGVVRSGVATRALPPVDAERGLLERVHAPAYLDKLEKLRGVRGMIDPDTYVAPRSIEAAVRAAGGSASLGRALASGAASRGVALVRPPGHHAEPDRAMGFCLLNNAALAAEGAREGGATKVAIVDIDVHHGNGTQAIYYRDPNTLYVSIHQWPFYPGTGAVDDRGEGPGLGTTVNVPLSQGADDDVYHEAMRRVVVPALVDFAADVVLISAGFDAFERDPLASMHVTPRGFADMVSGIVGAAERTRSPVGLVLEGGYDLDGLAKCLEASARALVEAGEIKDETRKLDPRHRAEIERAVLTRSEPR